MSLTSAVRGIKALWSLQLNYRQFSSMATWRNYSVGGVYTQMHSKHRVGKELWGAGTNSPSLAHTFYVCIIIRPLCMERPDRSACQLPSGLLHDLAAIIQLPSLSRKPIKECYCEKCSCPLFFENVYTVTALLCVSRGVGCFFPQSFF